MQKEKFSQHKSTWKAERRALKKKVRSLSEYLDPVRMAINDVTKSDTKTETLQRENLELKKTVAAKDQRITQLEEQLKALLNVSTKRVKVHTDGSEGD